MTTNKQDIKKVLKPLVKQCIKEVLFEDGVLSTLISEVIKGTSDNKPIVEQKNVQDFKIQQKQAVAKKQKKLTETRKKMLDAIGNDAFNGVNVFEGTTPAPAQASQGSQGPLSGTDPTDPGVDISSLLGNAGMWKKVVGK